MMPMVHMNRVLLGCVAVGLLAVLTVSIEGCTAVGLLFGMGADAAEGTGGPGKLLEIRPGQWVSLERWDGTSRQGRFIAMERDSGAVDTSKVLSLQNLSVRIQGERGEERIAATSIAKVRTPTMKGTIMGLVVGATIDVLIIRSAHQATRQPTCDPGTSLDGFSNAIPDTLETAPPEVQAIIERRSIVARP